MLAKTCKTLSLRRIYQYSFPQDTQQKRRRESEAQHIVHDFVQRKHLLQGILKSSVLAPITPLLSSGANNLLESTLKLMEAESTCLVKKQLTCMPV